MVGFSSRPISAGLGLIWPWLILILPGVTNAQTPAVPTPPSVNPVPVSPPATAPSAPVTPPTPTAVNPSPVSPPATAREGQLETRVQELETILRAGANREAQLEDRLRRLEELSRRTSALAGTASTAAPTAPAAGSQPERDLQLPARIGGVPVTRAGTPVASMPVPPLNIPGKVKFGPGFEISSEDGEYQVQFHDLTQLDGRFYGQSSQVDAHETFTFPREWFIFSGRLTKPFEYFVSFSRDLQLLQLPLVLAEHPLRRPAPVQGRSHVHAIRLRVVDRTDRLPDQPRAVPLHQQHRSGLRHRPDGLGPARQEADRIRRGDLQRDCATRRSTSMTRRTSSPS